MTALTRIKERLLQSWPSHNPPENDNSSSLQITRRRFLSGSGSFTALAALSTPPFFILKDISKSEAQIYAEYARTIEEYGFDNAAETIYSIAQAVNDYCDQYEGPQNLDRHFLFQIMIMKALNESHFGHDLEPKNVTNNDNRGVPFRYGLYHHSTDQFAIRLRQYGMDFFNDDEIAKTIIGEFLTIEDRNKDHAPEAYFNDGAVREEILDLRADPYAATWVECAYLVKDVMPRLQKITPNQPITSGKIYMEHVLGLGNYTAIQEGTITDEKLNDLGLRNPSLIFKAGYEEITSGSGTFTGTLMSLDGIKQAFEDRAVENLAYFQRRAIAHAYDTHVMQKAADIALNVG